MKLVNNLTRYYANAQYIVLRDFQTELQNWPMITESVIKHKISWN